MMGKGEHFDIFARTPYLHWCDEIFATEKGKCLHVNFQLNGVWAWGMGGLSIASKWQPDIDTDWITDASSFINTAKADAINTTWWGTHTHTNTPNPFPQIERQRDTQQQEHTGEPQTGRLWEASRMLRALAKSAQIQERERVSVGYEKHKFRTKVATKLFTSKRQIGSQSGWWGGVGRAKAAASDRNWKVKCTKAENMISFLATTSRKIIF